MKRHIQKTGVRRFFGQDLVELQAEPLAVLDGFFAEYGPCVIEGCAITAANGGTFDVSPGLVALECTDPDSGAVAVRTMPFTGAQGVALPLYLTANWKVVERVYDDGKVKPIGYDLTAVASGVVPQAPHLTLTAAGGNRFVDAVQDGTHRFITDTERSKWNDILRQAKEYAGLQAEAAKRTAMAHTDTTAAALRDEQAIADAVGLRSAKEYADRVVAALVDGSPELLNTLEELAGALGNDPHFATTVMTEIGKRATTTEVTAALADKAPAAELKTSGDCNDWTTPGKHYYVSADAHAATIANRPCDISFGLIFIANANGSQLAFDYNGGVYVRANQWQAGWSAWRTLYHSGNINPVREGEAVLSGEASAVVVENTGTGEQGTRRASLLLKWYKQFAGISVLRGGGSEVYGLGINIDNEIVAKFLRNGLMIGQHTVYHSGNLKIIRGSVTAIGTNGGGNAESVGSVYGEPAVVRVTHNLGTTAYSAQATAVSIASEVHSDNVVAVWRKGANYTDFVVTEGPGTGREMCAFDYVIIPY